MLLAEVQFLVLTPFQFGDVERGRTFALLALHGRGGSKCDERSDTAGIDGKVSGCSRGGLAGVCRGVNCSIRKTPMGFYQWPKGCQGERCAND